MFYRAYYHLKDNKIDTITIERTNHIFNYFMFVKDNIIVVNSSRKKLTKSAILFDIEIMNKYKAMELGYFPQLDGVTLNFTNIVKAYDIEIDDIRKAVENGRNYNKRTHRSEKPNPRVEQVYQRYVVGA